MTDVTSFRGQQHCLSRRHSNVRLMRSLSSPMLARLHVYSMLTIASRIAPGLHPHANGKRAEIDH
jgi:hypothetical protein